MISPSGKYLEHSYLNLIKTFLFNKNTFTSIMFSPSPPPTKDGKRTNIMYNVWGRGFLIGCEWQQLKKGT